MKQFILVIAVAFLLGGCASSSSIGSVAGGECRIVSAPKYVVRGRADYDNIWINKTTEAIVRACRQPRPLARPASLDAPRKVVVKAAPKKRTLRQFFGS